MFGTDVDFIETLKSVKSRRSISSTVSTAAVTSASTGFVELELAQVLGQRAGVDADAQRRAELACAFAMTSATFSGPPMLPGFRRTQCAPASIALSASVWLKWMSAMIGIGDSRDDRLQRLGVLLARHGDAHDVGAGLGDAADLVHRRLRGWRSPSWSSSARRPARRRRSGRRRRGSAARRPCGHDTNAPWPRMSPVRCTALGSRTAARARRLAPRRPRPGAAPRALLRADGRCGRGCRRRRRLRGARAARAGAGPRHHRRRPGRPPRLPRAVRAGRRRRGACPSPTARSTSPTPRRVIEHVAPARRARFAAELRRVARGLVRADPRLLVPDRAARAAALRALAAGRASGARTGASARRARGRTSRCCAAGSSRPCSPRPRSTPSASARS